MKVVVFGGGGFIGSSVIDRLLIDRHEVTVFERPRIDPYRKFKESEKVHWIYGDIMSTHDLNNALEGQDAVIHLVSTTLPKSSNDDPIFDVQSNLVGTLQMLDVMVKHNINKIVFISSGGTVYGNPVYLPIDEKHPTEPRVSYGVTKLAIEKYLMLYQATYNIKPVILRVTNPYGVRQRVETAQGAIGVFLSRSIQSIPIEIWGDGSVVRDYLYVSDVADAFVKALNYEGVESVFNISSNVGLSLNELIAMIEKTLNTKVMVNYQSGRAFDIQESILDNTLAQSELGWRPRITLEDGLERTRLWFQDILKN